MRSFVFVILLLCGALLLGWAATSPKEDPEDISHTRRTSSSMRRPMKPMPEPPERDTCLSFPEGQAAIEVHEWGVFAVYPDEAYAGVDMAAEWAGLPRFIYQLEPSRRLPYHGPVLKPVVYFHAKDDLPAGSIALTIRFSAGRPIVWFPGSTFPVDTGRQSKDKADMDHVSWKIFFRSPRKPRARQRRHPGRPLEWMKGRDQLRDVPAEHWYARLRAVASTPVYSWGSHSNLGRSVDQEKFVYYDGLTAPLKCMEIGPGSIPGNTR